MQDDRDADKDAYTELQQRLERHGLHLPPGDLEGLKAAVLEIEAGSAALRHDRPFSLEPAFALRLSPAVKRS